MTRLRFGKDKTGSTQRTFSPSTRRGTFARKNDNIDRLISMASLPVPGDKICAWRGAICNEPVTFKAQVEIVTRFGKQPVDKAVRFFCQKHGAALWAAAGHHTTK